MRTKRDHLGNFELMVLLAVMRQGEAYGVPLVDEIESRTGRSVALGSVYAALTRLENKGFVSSRLGEPTAERGGKAKRFFKVTGAGTREARGVRQALVSLWQGLPDTAGGAA